jgi:hypothetical protein
LFEKLGILSMAGRGGRRPNSGRPKNKPNKATIERAAIAERIIAEAEGKPGRKLGRELLEDFANMFGGLASAFQPTGTGPNGAVTSADLEMWAKSYKEPLFEKYAKLAAKCANDFADFQSPRLGRLQVAAPPPPPGGRITKKFTINIFDGNGRKLPRAIDVKPNSSVTSAAKN